MKKTIYFTGVNHQMGQLESAIKSATDKRDSWLAENDAEIGKIDKEDLKITSWHQNNSHVMVTIQITYYTK